MKRVKENFEDFFRELFLSFREEDILIPAELVQDLSIVLLPFHPDSSPFSPSQFIVRCPSEERRPR